MTRDEKIEALQAMMDDDTPGSVLSIYMNLAGQKILNRMYPFKEDFTDMDVPDRYAMLQLKLACYMLNKRGAEGEIQHIENGIHRNYGDADIPEQMLNDVVPYCQVIR